MGWLNRARTWLRYRRYLRSLMRDERDRMDLRKPVSPERYAELQREARITAGYGGRHRRRRS
jgi:hypothetical protein